MDLKLGDIIIKVNWSISEIRNLLHKLKVFSIFRMLTSFYLCCANGNGSDHRVGRQTPRYTAEVPSTTVKRLSQCGLVSMHFSLLK